MEIRLRQTIQLEHPRLFPRKILEENDWQSRFRAIKSPIAVSMGEIGCSVTLLERIAGVEPVTSAWEADVLPINYIRG